jgi:RNA 3'-terminal phosphate cyclase-like protein
VSLTAETTTGVILTKDFNFGNSKQFTLPEELGARAAYGMLDEVFGGGCIDSTNQSFALLLMAVSTGDNISALKLGRITQQSIALLRNLKSFFNVNFKIEQCQDDVYDDSSSEEENDSEEGEQEQNENQMKETEEKPAFA